MLSLMLSLVARAPRGVRGVLVGFEDVPHAVLEPALGGGLIRRGGKGAAVGLFEGGPPLVDLAVIGLQHRGSENNTEVRATQTIQSGARGVQVIGYR